MQFQNQKGVLLIGLASIFLLALLMWPTDDPAQVQIGRNDTEALPSSDVATTVENTNLAHEASDPISSHPLVVVNEVLAHTDLPQRDFIELYNTKAETADVSGWFITDKLKEPQRFRIPDGTLIPAYGYAVFDEYELGFAFKAEGESAYIHAADEYGNLTGYRHGFEFGVTPNGWSLGRCTVAEANAQNREHFTLQMAITEGRANAAPLVGPIVISELLYAPEHGDEFVELQNISSIPAPLYDPDAPNNQWQIVGLGPYVFPPNIIIPANGTLLVVSGDPETFRRTYEIPISVQIVGPYADMLSDDGERIVLMRPDVPNADGTVPYIEADVVTYEVASPWPDVATNGQSLERIHAAKFGDTYQSWRASIDKAGTPGVPFMAVSSRSKAAFVPAAIVNYFSFKHLLSPVFGRHHSVLADKSIKPQHNPCLQP